MIKALAALVAAALFLAPAAAQATITAPTFLGSAFLAAASGNNSIQITTNSNDCPVNSLLVVAVLIGSNVRHVTLVQDDSSQPGLANSYGLSNENVTTVSTSRQAQALLTRDVPANSHLTVTVTTGNAQPIIAAASCIPPGIASATPDSNGTGATGSSTNNPHFTASGATTQASEIVFDLLSWNASTGSVSNWGVDGAGNSFTAVATIPNGSVGYSMAWAYSIQSTINTPGTSITLSASENWAVNLYSYKGGTPVVPGGSNLMLRGVGE